MKPLLWLSTFVLLWGIISCDFNHAPEREPYLVDSSQVFVLNIEQNKITRLADGHSPRLLSDGSRILYFSNNSVYSIGTDSSSASLIGSLPYANPYLAMSNDRKLALTWTMANGQGDIFKIDPLTSSVVNVTRTNNKTELTPFFILHDTRILYSELIADTSTKRISRYAISVIDVDGQHYQRVTPDSVYYRFLGSTANDTRLVMSAYTGNLESSLTTILILDAQTFGTLDTIQLKNVGLDDWPQVTNDMRLLYHAHNSLLYELNLQTKVNRTIYSGYVGYSCAFSTHGDRAIASLDWGFALIDLSNGSSKQYFRDTHKPGYGSFDFSLDDKSVVYVLRTSSYVYP